MGPSRPLAGPGLLWNVVAPVGLCTGSLSGGTVAEPAQAQGSACHGRLQEEWSWQGRRQRRLQRREDSEKGGVVAHPLVWVWKKLITMESHVGLSPEKAE
ncbi:hypothetical protein NDU88_002063 [Pleurodeles waltl]|uniref:Uncharacterized protein n=1 Tax=Pleurodeles waltl TaxID=8319 RepID=A0AAV7UUI3_PLEWA|nr:hypothetical protein NDU88_002063 [Pleurodeles waltl]